MVYSASNNALKGRLGIALEIQGNDEGDLEFANGTLPLLWSPGCRLTRVFTVLEKAKRNTR